ncbi:MAG TPA: uroporphyrinogen decarboxylase family protein [Verrucomicrobiae bacterium]|nr:uroporphyrinogen decarboxylase family protein [Verrucomicrobiae bacterium]
MKNLGLSLLGNDYSGARVPVMEHIWGLSRQAIRHFTGIDPMIERHRINEAFRSIAEVFEVDLLWGGGLPDERAEVFNWDDGQKVKRNRDGQTVVQWGMLSAAHQEDGRHFVHVPKPSSVDEALAFQPLLYFPKTVDQYREEFARSYAEMLASTGDTCYPIPHHYTTCFHWPLAIFGFELLCEAGMEEDRFADLIARFVEVSTRVTTAWSQVPNLKAFILHDDLTMTGGPIFAPDWYRRHIFVHYPAICAPLRQQGIPIIFTSDGNCSEFVDDIFAAGADGLNFEYLVGLERLVRAYPDKILIGNINSATIANGPIDAIEREVRQCLEIGSCGRRFVVNVGGGLTHNAPIEHLEAYLASRKQLCRTVRQRSS